MIGGICKKLPKAHSVVWGPVDTGQCKLVSFCGLHHNAQDFKLVWIWEGDGSDSE